MMLFHPFIHSNVHSRVYMSIKNLQYDRSHMYEKRDDDKLISLLYV